MSEVCVINGLYGQYLVENVWADNWIWVRYDMGYVWVRYGLSMWKIMLKVLNSSD